MEGDPETNSAKDLLSVGFGVWLYTILAFAFLYWVDEGGFDARLWAPPEYPNLGFPEQLNPVVAPPGCSPGPSISRQPSRVVAKPPRAPAWCPQVSPLPGA